MRVYKRSAKRFIYEQVEMQGERGIRFEVSCYKRNGKDMVKINLESKEYTFYGWVKAAYRMKKLLRISDQEFERLLLRKNLRE